MNKIAKKLKEKKNHNKKWPSVQNNADLQAVPFQSRERDFDLLTCSLYSTLRMVQFRTDTGRS